MTITLYESGYPCYPYDSKDNSVVNKTIKIGDYANKMPTKKITPPPPLSIENCFSRRTQKDSVDIESTTKKLTFDDLESAPKPPVKTRQGDSMTTRVNTVVDTPVVIKPGEIIDGTCKGAGAGEFAPLPTNYGRVCSDRQIAPLPEEILQVLHPGAVVIAAPQELFIGMVQPKKALKIPQDMNTVLACGNGYAAIKASDLVNPHYRQAPPIVY